MINVLNRSYESFAVNPVTMTIDKVFVTKTDYEAHHEYKYEFPDGTIRTASFSANSEYETANS